jgi:hypothetical protein
MRKPRRIRLPLAASIGGAGCGEERKLVPQAFPLEGVMSDKCSHTDAIREVTPSARGCEECLKTGSVWVHLRLCRTCGHVGCCDDSPNRNATKHFRATGHPVIEGYDPPESWGWCYIDETFLDLSDHATPQLGPIPRYF